MLKRALMLVFPALFSVSGCGAGPTSPAASDRVGPYVAVVRYLTSSEPSSHLYVDTAVCSRKRTAPACADLSAREQAGIVSTLSSQGITVRILDPARKAAVSRRVFKGQASLITFGVTTTHGNDLAIYAWIGCGNVCGTGATWLVTRSSSGWVVNGPVPGTGVAVA